jgi:hypothetical protein
MTNAKIALAKFTNDSIASDNKLTESVMYQAMVFITMVMMATTTEAHSRVFGDILLNKFMACIVK